MIITRRVSRVLMAVAVVAVLALAMSVLSPASPIVSSNIASSSSSSNIPSSSIAGWLAGLRQKPASAAGKTSLAALAFYADLFTLFDRYRPSVAPLANYTDGHRAQSVGWDKVPTTPLTDDHLGQYLQVSNDDLFELNRCHRGVVDHLPQAYPAHLYKGDGVVIVAGGKFMPMAIASVKVLRETGSQLPVEIFLANEAEYEVEICEDILPRLNAKCVLLPDAIGEEALDKFPLKRYQFKALSLLASSFENVLLMDADNYLLKKPEYIFSQEPFASKGYIFWPDYWRRATSPHYYQVAGVELGPRVRFGDPSDLAKETPPTADLQNAIPDPSCESGQLLVSKRSHYRAIMLSVYYNLFGPDIYYPLFSQGSSGEGDKETFIAGPVFFQEPFYQVSEFIWTLGFSDSEGFHGTSMSQFDPVEDYEYIVTKTRSKPPTPLFVHNHMPKLNPPQNIKDGDFFNKDGQRVRILGNREGIKDKIPFDLELKMWQAAKSMVCEMNTIPVAWSAGNENMEEVCKEVNKQVKFLVESG